MTKIQIYQQAAGVAKKVAEAVSQCLGRDDPRNDKASFLCRFSHIGNEQFRPMYFNVHASHGYYGSSSGYSDTSEELGKYLADAINANRAMLLDHAARLAAKDAEDARIDAQDEARAILIETAPKKGSGLVAAN